MAWLPFQKDRKLPNKEMMDRLKKKSELEKNIAKQTETQKES